MKSEITIIDYDSGNLRSAAKAFEHVGAKVTVTRDPKVIEKAEKLVLPGQGSFGHCMESLEKYGLVKVCQTLK